MTAKTFARFPKSLHGSVVVYPADRPADLVEGETENYRVARQRDLADSYPWRVYHVVKSSKSSEFSYQSEDAAIKSGRKLAQDFNTDLFVEDETAIREIAVELDGEVDQNLLSKVRKLIAKAENTDSEHERDAFLAKAQEWMVRHAIDESLVKEGRENPMTERKVVVGSKGAGVWAKRNLVNSVARYCNLRSWSNTWSYFSTMAGFREDVEYADMLITSLMLQLEQEYSVSFKNDKPEWTDARTFRANFMEAFVDRVGARLSSMQAKAKAEAAKAAQERSEGLTDAEASTSVSLVLRNRKEKVNEWVDGNHKFVKVRRNMGSYCGAGRQAGGRAGDRADLSGGRTKQIGNKKAVEA